MIQIKAKSVNQTLGCAQIGVPVVVRFHFEHEMPMGSIDVLRMEHTGTRLEAARGLVPLAAVEVVEIVAPVELELVVDVVVSEHLHVVVQDVPRHINWIETSAPGVESGRPEVHSQSLRLVQMAHSRVMQVKMAHLVAIDGPRDVVRGPLHLVDVPLVMWVEQMRVVM